MNHRASITPVRLALQTCLSLLFVFACMTALLCVGFSLPLRYSVPLLLGCSLGLLGILVVLGILYNHRMTYGLPIWRKPTLMEDPVFGRMRYMPDGGCWYCLEPSSFGNKLDEVEDFIIYADKRGPTEHQRQVLRDLLDGFDDLALEIEELLHTDYLKWCDIVRKEVGHNDLEKVRDFPLLAILREAYESTTFAKLEVASEAHERGPNCDVYLYLCAPWEEEHDRDIFIKDGRVFDWGVV